MSVLFHEQETKKAIAKRRNFWREEPGDMRHATLFPNSWFRNELWRQYHFATITFSSCFVSEFHLRDTVGFLLGICAPLADVTPKGSGNSCEWLRKHSLSRKKEKYKWKLRSPCGLSRDKLIYFINPNPFKIKSDELYSSATAVLQF